MQRDPARAWNVIYSFLTENMDKKDRDKLDSDLFRRPTGSTRKVSDKFDTELQKAANEYLKSLPPNFGLIDLKEEKGEA